MSSQVVVFATALLMGAPGQDRKAADEPPAEITGTVTHLQRVALPPEAVIRVQLQDVSRSDVPPTLVAEVTVPTAGKQVPVPFRLPYDPAAIDPTHRYGVRAIIQVGAQMTFASANATPVLTQGAPSQVAIVVQPVAARAPAASDSPRPPAGLLDTYWKLVDLAGEPAAVSGVGREPHLVLHAEGKRMAGWAGCNALGGSYELSGQALRFVLGPSTMMACPEPFMKQEQAFLEALKATTSFRVFGDVLELRSGERSLARFEARSPK